MNNDPFSFYRVNLQVSGGKWRCDFERLVYLYCCLSNVQKSGHCCFLSDCVSTLSLPHENNFDKSRHISPFFYFET